MEPREAVLAVLREEAAAVHWTKIVDLALRRGYLDPFEHPDVRRLVRSAIQGLIDDGAVRKADRGVYEAVEPAGDA